MNNPKHVTVKAASGAALAALTTSSTLNKPKECPTCGHVKSEEHDYAGDAENIKHFLRCNIPGTTYEILKKLLREEDGR